MADEEVYPTVADFADEDMKDPGDVPAEGE